MASHAVQNPQIESNFEDLRLFITHVDSVTIFDCLDLQVELPDDDPHVMSFLLADFPAIS